MSLPPGMLGPGVEGEDRLRSAGGQWYGGHTAGAPSGAIRSWPCTETAVRPGTGRGRCGVVRAGAWAGRRVREGPEASLARASLAPIIRDMQIIGAATSAKPGLPSVLLGAAVGTVLVVSGLTIEFATLVTPYVDTIAAGRFGGPNALGGVLVRWLDVALGSIFLGVGAARLTALISGLRIGVIPQPDLSEASTGDEPVMALNVDVGDGRSIPKVVIGRFGAAVIRDLPSPSMARHEGPYWEGRTDQGWTRIESPLDRASRDAERVRRWFADEDRDYVVRVYAAVIAPEANIVRTPTCAVITAFQLESWLRSLPVQRSLSEARRNQLIAMLRGRR